MKLKERLENMEQLPADNLLVEQIEKLYQVSLSNELKKIVSFSQATVFYEDRPSLRSLSNAEILNANAELSVDFTGKSLLPVFDIGDNDYIVFDFLENRWCLFNIVDEVKFNKASDLSAYL